MGFFFFIVFIVSVFIVARAIRQSEIQRQLEENQRKWEEEQAAEEQERIEKEAEQKREEQAFCEELNEVCRQEYDAWISRFCSEDNPGYKIAGINLQKLTDRYLGAFKGTLKAEEYNAFDPKAVAIYRGQKKVGYVPKEFSAQVFDSLDDGKGVCYGCIYKWYKLEQYIGRIENYAGRIVIGPSKNAEHKLDM